MFKAVYFHKTVSAAEVMLLEALRLSDDEFGFSKFRLDEFVKLTDELCSIESHLLKIIKTKTCKTICTRLSKSKIAKMRF